MSFWTDRSPIRAALIATFATTLVIAGPEREPSTVTTRSLAHDLAAAAAAAGVPPDTVLLVRADIGPRPDAPVTEGAAVALLKRLGIGASTSDPGRALTRERADALVRQYRAALASRVASRDAAVGRRDLPSGVDSCFQEQNHGSCVECCKNLGGGASSCAKACMVINKPSPDEPLP